MVKDKNGKMAKSRRIFTEVEKQFLMQLVSKEKNILELRQNTGKVLKAKADAWERIVTKFNAQASGGRPCDVPQLKKVVDNLKLKAKKDMAQEKKSRALTGGGSIEEASVAGELSQMVASYCNEVLHPLENDEDDDAGYHETKRKCILFTPPQCSSTRGSRCPMLMNKFYWNTSVA
jgi:hypothetical protein